jgi:succinate dehydrogenase flavin-adding protein (antitoxin of CptAB toxin-antitoxin module)
MNKRLSIDEIKELVKQFAGKISLSKHISYYVRYGSFIGDGIPCVQVDNTGYHYIYSERGKEFDRKTTQESNELLYWIFEDITFVLSSNSWKTSPHKKDWEQRRIIFVQQLHLMREIDISFEKRLKKEYNELVKRIPFDDGLPNNMDYETWDLLKIREEQHSIPTTSSIDSLMIQVSTEDF